MNHIVCVKWGNKYISKYANVLYNMVKRNTTVPYEFHCITDDTNQLDSHINVLNLPTDPWIKTWWSKLWMFGSHFPLKGDILYFDLDVIIFKNIDLLFSHNPGKFHTIRDFNRCRVKDWKLSNSSVMRWEAGKFVHPHDACFDAQGNIFVAEWVATGRVTKLKKLS